MRALGWVFLIVIGGMIYAGSQGAKAPAGGGSGSVSSREMVLTEAMRRDIGALIRARGYNCPLPKLAFSEETDAYGNVTSVYCGPADRDAVYKNAKFRVTFRPDRSVMVAPWRE